MQFFNSTLALLVMAATFGLDSSWAVAQPSVYFAQENSQEKNKAFSAETTVYLLCRLKSGQRGIARTLKVVSVENPEGRRCQTVYTKSGRDRVVGWGRTNEGCLKILKNIEANLKAAGWKCKDISSAKVSRGSV